VIPPIPGLAGVPYWTTHDAVEAETLPASLVVLGGGAVGCELGQVFARFGVDVTIVEGQERLLPAAEPEASRLVEDALRRDGINVRSGTLATGVHSHGDGVMVHLDSGDTVRAQTLLLALGRRADADSLGVTSAGARTDHGFIVVDEQLRAAEGMWAIGDVTGRGLLTEVAVYQGLLAVEDILGKHPPRADYSAVPITVFTDPEIGSVGLTEQAARDQGHDVAVTVKDVQATFRGWLHRVGGEGTIKLVVDCEQDRLLGATVVGPRASDVLGFLAVAVQARVPVSRLGTMIYAFPTFYGGIGEAIGAYGRGLVRVLDPDATPLLDDG
jgi:pyruvate/2-oxoglutarate dehydrogenase complex dihydrolipoamide dehydrogenase (E3) component